jgi:hypothetical protein
MSDAAEGLPLRSSIVVVKAVLILFLCSFVSRAFGQSGSCFSLALSKEGEHVANPTNVTFLDSTRKFDAEMHGSLYCLPTELLEDKLLDFSFISGKVRLYLTRIPVGSFHGVLSIDYGKTASARTPNSNKRRANRACVITFEGGEPETGLVQNPCVVPAKPLL